MSEVLEFKMLLGKNYIGNRLMPKTEKGKKFLLVLIIYMFKITDALIK